MPNAETVNNRTNYTLIRSKRKTIAFYITDAGLEVRAPIRTSIADIDCFIELQSGWIDRHLSERSRILDARANFSLTYGDKVVICGAEYPIVGTAIGKAMFAADRVIMPIDLTPKQIRLSMITLYKELATEIICKRVKHYAYIMGAHPASVRIGSAKSRWGSCSGGNGLNFTWLLIIAPDDVIDYVVVHELAHTIRHDHSKAFWSIVSEIFPNYNEQKKSLRELQCRLSEQCWM